MQWRLNSKARCASQKLANGTNPSRRWGRKVTLGLLLLLITLWCWQKITNPATFPIREVKIVDAQSHINHEVIRQTILPYLNNGILWLNQTDLKNALLQIPWAAQVKFTRLWPDKLVVTLIEQQPIAYWNNQQLLNTNLTPFNPGNVYPQQALPSLSGPEDQQALVWQYYQAINTELAPLKLSLSKLSLSPRGAWEGQLNNGLILLLGRENILNRLAHFVQVYPKIFANNTSNVDYIDLRYNNGLAVKWKNSTNNPATP